MLNIILFGPPGSGKGTQSQKLIAKYGLKHLSTGDLLRNEIAFKTPLGIEAKAIMEKGLLVPDEVVIGMIGTALEENPYANGFLFDGFPRTEAQSEALDNLLELKNTEIKMLLALEVSEDELISRIQQRSLTSGRDDDANVEIIKARIAEYHKKTSVVEDYYKKFNKVQSVNGEGSVDEIFKALCEKIDNHLS